MPEPKPDEIYEADRQLMQDLAAQILGESPAPKTPDAVVQQSADPAAIKATTEAASAPSQPDTSPQIPQTGEPALATPDKAATPDQELAKAPSKPIRRRTRKTGGSVKAANTKSAKRKAAQTSGGAADATDGSPEPPHTAPAGDGVASSTENLPSGETFEISEGKMWSHAITRDGVTVTETIFIDSFDATSGMVHITKSSGLNSAQREITKDALIQKLRDGDYRLSNSPLNSHAASEKAAVPSGESASEKAPLPSRESAPVPSPDTPPPSSAESTPERAAALLRGRNPKDYHELFEGDEWVLLGPDGQITRKISDIHFVFQGKHKNTVNVFDSAEADKIAADPDDKDGPGQTAAGYNDIDLEILRRLLQEQGFVLQKAGDGRSERYEPKEGSLSSKERMAEAQKAVAEARAKFLDIEDVKVKEQGLWERAKQVLRDFAGKEPTLSPEVTQAMRAYQEALELQLSLYREKWKSAGITGEALQYEIAKMNFEEGEQRDEERRSRRLAKQESLKERIQSLWEKSVYYKDSGKDLLEEKRDWLKVLAGGANIVGEQGVAGVKWLGRNYNKLTDTKGKKIAMAVGGGGLAAALVFSGGSAAAVAGVLLALKRLAAGAGAGAALHVTAEAVAKGLRERSAKKDVEEAFKILNVDKTAPLSETQWQEIEIWLKEQTIENLAAHDARRKMGRLWRTTGAVFAGALLAGTAPGALASGVEAAQEASTGRGGRALREIARSIERGASLPAAVPPIPGGAASAAEAASAPAPLSGASAAQMANASPEGGASAPGGARTLVTPDTHPPTDNRWPNIFNQAQFAHIPEAEWNGTTPDGAPGGPGVEATAGTESSSGRQPLTTLLTDRTIRQGDTIWKFGVEAAQAAQLDASGQQRFSNLLTQTLREKLSMVSPAEAAKFGFYPNPDGLLTPDYIRADDKVNIVGLLGEEKVAKLIEQAQTGTTSSAVAQSAAEAIDPHKAYSSLQEAAQVSKMYSGMVEPTLATSSASDRLLAFIDEHNLHGRNAVTEAMAEYLRTLPQGEQHRLFRNMMSTVWDLLDTPDKERFLNERPLLAKTSMLRILSGVQYGESSAQAMNATQGESIITWSKAVGKVLGQDVARPLKGEDLQGYVQRITVMAHAKNAALPPVHDMVH